MVWLQLWQKATIAVILQSSRMEAGSIDNFDVWLCHGGIIQQPWQDLDLQLLSILNCVT